MKKRKHHYVWRHYLEAWANDGRVWCSTRGKRFLSSTENIAQERDFYRLQELSADDIEWVEKLVINPMDPSLQVLVRGWVPHFRVFHDAKRAHEASGRSDPELERLLDEAINNLEEDLHAVIERKAIHLLAELKEGRTAVLQGAESASIVRRRRTIDLTRARPGSLGKWIARGAFAHSDVRRHRFTRSLVLRMRAMSEATAATRSAISHGGAPFEEASQLHPLLAGGDGATQLPPVQTFGATQSSAEVHVVPHVPDVHL